MSNDERNAGTSGVLLSFLLGALSGAALAILFAPARGGRHARSSARSSARPPSEAASSASVRWRRARRCRGRLLFVDRGRDVLEKRRDRLAAAVEAGRQAFRDEKEKM